MCHGVMRPDPSLLECRTETLDVALCLCGSAGWPQRAQAAEGTKPHLWSTALPLHTPGPPDLLVELLSNVELKRIPMTSLVMVFGFPNFNKPLFAKDGCLKLIDTEF